MCFCCRKMANTEPVTYYDVTTVNHVHSYNGTGSSSNVTSSYNLEGIVVPVIWSILILIGSVGNGLVVYVLLRFGERSTTNYYIINLAVTDLAFLLICVPFTMMHYVSHWSFGENMCKFVMYMIYVSINECCTKKVCNPFLSQETEKTCNGNLKSRVLKLQRKSFKEVLHRRFLYVR